MPAPSPSPSRALSLTRAHTPPHTRRRAPPPRLAQVVLISATMPGEILEMSAKFMTDPVRILVKRDELTLEGIKQARAGRLAALARHAAHARQRQSSGAAAAARPVPPLLKRARRLALCRAALCAAPPQFFVAVEREEWKFDTLCDLYDTLTITQARAPAFHPPPPPDSILKASPPLVELASARPRPQMGSVRAWRRVPSPPRRASTLARARAALTSPPPARAPRAAADRRRAGGHFLQHQEKSRLADREDAAGARRARPPRRPRCARAPLCRGARARAVD